MKLSPCATALALALLAAPAFANPGRTPIRGPDGGEVICQESGGSLDVKTVVCLFKGYLNRTDKPQTYLFPEAFAVPPAHVAGPMPPVRMNQTRAAFPLPTRTAAPVNGWLILEGF